MSEVGPLALIIRSTSCFRCAFSDSNAEPKPGRLLTMTTDKPCPPFESGHRATILSAEPLATVPGVNHEQQRHLFYTSQ